MASPALPPHRRRWWARALALAALTGWAYAVFAPRPEGLPLATWVDGPTPAAAARLLVLLHGAGGTLEWGEAQARALRQAGLPPDVAVVAVQAPFPLPAPFRPWRHQWGHDAEAQARSRARLRTLLDGLLAGDRPPPERVTVAGFSQGAGVALDVAVEDTRVGRVASFSPCASFLRGALPTRAGLQLLLAHGRADTSCPVEESRTLFEVLEAAHRPVRYLESAGGHEVPPEALRALVELVTAP